jgi:hypothetical protein
MMIKGFLMRRKFDGFVWEILVDDPASAVKRAKIIGGWLVVHQTYFDIGTQKARLSESMQFVPDKDHEWLILNLKE